MKFSIWQQFSSNHSGMFTVLGRFRSIRKAGKAHKEIEELLLKVEAHYRERRKHSKDIIIDVTDYEKAIASKYQIEWTSPIDFLDINAEAKGTIEQFEDVLVISNPDQTWMSKQAFEDLLSKMGAEVAGYDLQSIEYGEGVASYWKMTIQGTAPDEETLKLLEGHLQVQASLASGEIGVEGLVISYKGYFDLERLSACVIKLRKYQCTNVNYRFEKEEYK